MPFATNESVRIYYEVEGAGEPLVLVHQLSSSLQSWRDNGFVEPLKQEHRLILVDARGHGQSDKPHEAEAYTPDRMADDVIAVLDALGVAQAHYLGYSLGAMMGLVLAGRAPGRWCSLMLGGIDPLGRSTEAERQTMVMGRAMLAKAAAVGGGQVAVARMESSGRSLPAETREMLLNNDPAALVAAIDGMMTWPGAGEDLASISTPCLIWAGAADSLHDRAREAAGCMPSVTFVSVPGLDHNQAGARSDLVLPHIQKFLRETATCRGSSLDD